MLRRVLSFDDFLREGIGDLRNSLRSRIGQDGLSRADVSDVTGILPDLNFSGTDDPIGCRGRSRQFEYSRTRVRFSRHGAQSGSRTIGHRSD